MVVALPTADPKGPASVYHNTKTRNVYIYVYKILRVM